MTPKTLHVRLLDRKYRLRLVRSIEGRRSTQGTCDPPTQANKEIQILSGLHPKEELEVTLHECLHACAWKLLSEEWVSDSAHDLAHVLWRLGYRKEAENV